MIQPPDVFDVSDGKMEEDLQRLLILEHLRQINADEIREKT